MKVEEFQKLVEYISKHYTVVGLHNMGDKASKPKIVLSFDDGYYDFIENVLPLLLDKGLPSNMNVVTDCLEKKELIWTQRINNILNFLYKERKKILLALPYTTINIDFSRQNIVYYKNKIQSELYHSTIDEIRTILTLAEKSIENYQISKNDRMMDWNDVLYCHQKGVTIGSHTQSHAPLQYVTNENILYKELAGSKQIIEEKLNAKIDVMAYANGFYNDKVIEVSTKVGYKYLLLVKNKFYYLSKKPGSCCQIPRILIHHNDTYSNLLVASGISTFR
ncbi:MAG TPA: polysaccharide deacetylase family protein [Chitinophagaceae bacterium]|nr:polysaccharide deacetylase family protein [Chitinophagaceae bacterium]